MKVSDSLDIVPNENVVTHLGTDQLSDQLLKLLEWLFATKNRYIDIHTLMKSYTYMSSKFIKKTLDELPAVVSHLPGELVPLCGPSSNDPHQGRGGGAAGAGHAAGGRGRG